VIYEFFFILLALIIPIRGCAMTYDYETILTGASAQFQPELDQHGITVNLKELIRALVQRESNTTESAITVESNVNDFSIGYGQLRIDTASGILNMPAVSQDQRDAIKSLLLDGKVNLFVTASYLTSQLVRYSGDVKLTLSAYNAGSAMFNIDGEVVYYDEKGFFVVNNGSRVDVSGNYDITQIDDYAIGNASYVDDIYNAYQDALSSLALTGGMTTLATPKNGLLVLGGIAIITEIVYYMKHKKG
jgi:hypothetical protein